MTVFCFSNVVFHFILFNFYIVNIASACAFAVMINTTDAVSALTHTHIINTDTHTHAHVYTRLLNIEERNRCAFDMSTLVESRIFEGLLHEAQPRCLNVVGECRKRRDAFSSHSPYSRHVYIAHSYIGRPQNRAAWERVRSLD